MPGVSRVGVDVAGGVIVGNLVPSVHVNGVPIVVKGAAVANHGRSPHDSAHTAGSSATVKAGGILICRAGDVATCGHACAGSPNVSAG